MQSTTSKRVLSTLAARIHPQLPLSPRESQQLLDLLTTSFRNHLDRAHPRASQDNSVKSHNVRRDSSPARVISSYAAASRHMDAILTNPLFAVNPHRRGSGTAAVDVLKDPMAWFLNEIAKGTADLPKAAMCLEALEKSKHEPLRRPNKNSPAAIVARWLHASTLDSSARFLDLCLGRHGHGSMFLDRLVHLLMADGESSTVWRWFICSNEQRIKDTGYGLDRVAVFRQQMLRKIVAYEASISVQRGLRSFMQAFRMAEVEGHSSAYSLLRLAGAHLVNRITSHPNHEIEPQIYQAFLQSCPRWLDRWSPAVEAMLWLHHPTCRDALVGHRFIQDPAGAIQFVNASRNRRSFLVQLCLGVARELVDKKMLPEVQTVMVFLKNHMADIVLSRTRSADQPSVLSDRQRKERENLQLLDHLIPV